MHGDTLVADYTFQSEGTTSIRQVVFLRRDIGFIEGFGPALAAVEFASVAADAEVAKVGQNTDVGLAYLPDGAEQPLTVGGVAAVVFDYHVEAGLLGIGAQAAQAFYCGLLHFLGRALTKGIDAHRGAAEVVRGIHPFVVVFDGFLALGRVGGT
nr:hypothetical protein [Tanacetum cinerariifolium]